MLLKHLLILIDWHKFHERRKMSLENCYVMRKNWLVVRTCQEFPSVHISHKSLLLHPCRATSHRLLLFSSSSLSVSLRPQLKRCNNFFFILFQLMQSVSLSLFLSFTLAVTVVSEYAIALLFTNFTYTYAYSTFLVYTMFLFLCCGWVSLFNNTIVLKVKQVKRVKTLGVFSYNNNNNNNVWITKIAI